MSVAEMPHSGASLEFGDTAYTSARLAEAVAGMQRDCLAAGISASSPVVIHTGLSDRYVIAVLALSALKSCIVPVPPSVPAHLLSHIIESTGATAVIGEIGITVPGRPEPRNPLLTHCGDDAAYVLFTSGSTGAPKGVVGSRRGLANRIAWGATSLYSQDVRRCAVRTNPIFVDSLTEILCAYARGRTMVVAPPDAQRDLGQLCDFIATKRIEQVTMTPSAVPVLADVGRDRLRGVLRWILSGEELRSRWLTQLRRLSPAADVINSYGSTEVSGDVTFFTVAHTDPSLIDVPIGRAAPGVQIRIERSETVAADHHCGPCDAGELVIGGEQVAHGYLQSADTLRSGPFQGAESGTRWFRTGDLVRRDGDTLYYLGRCGSTAKVRGHRVDLAGVAATLESLDGVAQAHVWVGRGPDDTSTLHAAVTARLGTVLTATVLLEQARRRVHEHLVPDRIHILEEFPRTATGKIDRQRIEHDDTASHPPRSRFDSGLQHVVAYAISTATWAPDLGPTTALSGIGLDSLQAVRVADELSRYFGCRITAIDILSATNIQELAERIPALQFSSGISVARIVRDGGEDRTLVLLHPAIGTCLGYFALIQRLSYPGRIIFVEQDDTARATLDTDGIGALARYYAQQAASLCTNNGVDVAGYSFGALIAPTFAAELTNLGLDVSSIILIDPTHAAMGTTLSHDWALRRVLTDGGYRDHLPETDLDLAHALKIIHRIEGPLRHVPDQLVAHWANCLTVNARAVADYRATTTSAPTLMLRAADTTGTTDTKQTWSPHQSNTTVLQLPGTHFDLLNGDTVAATAAAVEDFLRRLVRVDD